MMMRRVISAVVLLGVIFLGFTFPNLEWIVVIATIAIALLCTLEISRMMKRKGLRVYRRIASIGVMALMIEAILSGMAFSGHVFGVAVCLAWLLRMTSRVRGAWGDVSATCFTLAYVGLPMAAFMKIFHGGPEAKAWLLLMLALVWTTDTFALFSGKLFGKTKLWPTISPGKTWEGSIGGVFGALLLIVVTRFFFSHNFPGVTNIEFVAFALLFSPLSQLGDLAESLLKRDVGVKDSGSQLTGHGGFLDLMDAALFCAIPLLIYLELIHPGILPPRF